jgi:hypothetical protein
VAMLLSRVYRLAGRPNGRARRSQETRAERVATRAERVATRAERVANGPSRRGSRRTISTASRLGSTHERRHWPTASNTARRLGSTRRSRHCAGTETRAAWTRAHCSGRHGRAASRTSCGPTWGRSCPDERLLRLLVLARRFDFGQKSSRHGAAGMQTCVAETEFRRDNARKEIWGNGQNAPDLSNSPNCTRQC